MINLDDLRNEIIFISEPEKFLPNVNALIDNAEKMGSEGNDLVSSIYLDLNSRLTCWKLDLLLKNNEIKASDIAKAKELLLAFLDSKLSSKEMYAVEKELYAIQNSLVAKMSKMAYEGELSTSWGHDYTTGISHSLRRGARFSTSNPAKINLFRKDCPQEWAEIVEKTKKEFPVADTEKLVSVLTARIVSKYCAKPLYPIFVATKGKDGFSCLQVNPKNIGDADKMIDEVLAWNEQFKKELGCDEVNIVYKLPAVPAAIPAVKHLVAKGFRICMTLNFTVTQHEVFADLLANASGRCFVVLMSGFLDDNVNKELTQLGMQDAALVSKYAGLAVIRKSYKNILPNKNVSIMAAAIRGDYTIRSCFTDQKANPVYFTTITEKILEFDCKARDMSVEIEKAIPEEIMQKLLKSKIFAKAYSDTDKDILGAIDSYEPLCAVLSAFNTAYDEVYDAVEGKE